MIITNTSLYHIVNITALIGVGLAFAGTNLSWIFLGVSGAVLITRKILFYNTRRNNNAN